VGFLLIELLLAAVTLILTAGAVIRFRQFR